MAMYDGGQMGEACFFHFPQGVALQNSAVGGTLAGTFSFCAVYEWVDNQGQRHQSAPSPPLTFTTDGSHNGIIYSCQPLMFGVRAANCSVVFYRTVNAGTTFYRLNTVASPIANDRTAATVGGTDTTATSSATADPITANEILYTTGGALPNDNPPACNAISSYQGRIVYANAENGQDWRFSQSTTPGQGLYFNEALLGAPTQQDAGPLSAIAALDDKLILATQTRKFWTSGTGPNAAGLNGSYAAPQLLPSDVGIVDQRASVVVPDVQVDDPPLQVQRPGGLIHATKHGLYMLGRGLTDSYVGMPVDSSYSSSSIGSATLEVDKSQARWVCGSNVLVYDYLFGQWSIFSGSVTPTCSTIWNGLWTFGYSGHLAQDSTGPGRDFGTTAVTLSLSTAWIKLAALQAFQRVKYALVFGAYGSPSTLTCTAFQDYSTQLYGGIVSPILGVTTSPIVAISEASANIVAADLKRWQLRWHQQIQKCEAIQFQFSDTPTGGDYSGLSFSGLTLELGIKKGSYKLPARVST
jgi:hypothetical protein